MKLVSLAAALALAASQTSMCEGPKNPNAGKEVCVVSKVNAERGTFTITCRYKDNPNEILRTQEITASLHPQCVLGASFPECKGN